MSYGYTCDWCKSPGKATGSQRDYPQLPEGWAKISYNEHVCAACLKQARKSQKK